PVELVQGAVAESLGVSRKPLARRGDELRGYVNPEVIDVRAALAQELEHDAGAAADVEHRGHSLEQLDGLETGRMVPPLVAQAQEVLHLRRREASPRLLDLHRALRRADSRPSPWPMSAAVRCQSERRRRTVASPSRR